MVIWWPALLALVGLVALRSRMVVPLLWLFNTWGLLDLVNAVARGVLFTPDGALGTAYWIPAVLVPMLVVSHVYIYARLWRERLASAGRQVTA